MNDIKLYIGCGPLPLHKQHLQIIDDSWILIDNFVNDPSIVKMDARNLDYPDGLVSKVYTSHLLEHFGIKEVPVILKEWYRVLKYGGEMIINVPDTMWAAEELIRLGNGEVPRSKVFNTQKMIMEILYGNQEHEGEFHKIGFTEESLNNYLIDAGFKDIKLKRIYEAHDMMCLVGKAMKYE